jgi:hypothetical protein
MLGVLYVIPCEAYRTRRTFAIPPTDIALIPHLLDLLL